MPTFRQNTLALLVLFSLPAGATDYQVIYDGGLTPASISGRLNDNVFFGEIDPIYHRPFYLVQAATCDQQVHVEDYRYDTIKVINTSGVDVDINLEVDNGFCDQGHNSVVFGYAEIFAPDDPVTNCFVVDDDYFVGNGGCSFIRTALIPDQTAVFVITTHGPNQTWPWTATLTFEEYIFVADFECLSGDYDCGGSP